MVIALYMFALAMIVGGAAVVAQGYGIILNERGWTMVIAGTVAATSGVLLLGIATIAGRLGQMQRELAELRERSTRLEASGVAPAPAPRTISAATAVESAAMGEVAGASGPAQQQPAANDERPELAVLRAADVIPEPSGPEAAAADSGASGRTPPNGAPEPAEPPPGAPPPTVIGTYNSGGNAYVMYSDGSIEADTPSGRFRFDSLDELKEFIAAGGEDGTGASRAS